MGKIEGRLRSIEISKLTIFLDGGRKERTQWLLGILLSSTPQCSTVKKTRWRTFGHRNNLKDSSFYVLGRVYLEWFVVQIYLSSMMNQYDNILISRFIDRDNFMRSLHFPSFQFRDL